MTIVPSWKIRFRTIKWKKSYFNSNCKEEILGKCRMKLKNASLRIKPRKKNYNERLS